MVATARAVLATAVGARSAAEEALRVADADLLTATKAIADRREGLARLAGQVTAARSRMAASDDEVARLAVAVAEARQRGKVAGAEFAALQSSVGALDSSEVGLDESYEAAAAAADQAAGRLAELGEAVRQAQQDRAGLLARVDALSLGLDRRDGVGALLAAGSELPGVLGSVASLLDVRPGHEAALAAALGAVADAAAADGPTSARSALEYLRRNDSGRAGIFVGSSGADPGPPGARPTLPDDAVWAIDQVTAPPALMGALRRALDGVAVVDSLADAARLIDLVPGTRAVTRGGDLLGQDWAVGGSAGKKSVLEIQAAVDEGEQSLAAVTARLTELEAAVSGARAEAAARSAEADVALGRAARLRREAVRGGRSARPGRADGPVGRSRGGTARAPACRRRGRPGPASGGEG